MRDHRGTALLSVLWVVLILSIISFTLAASVRTEIGSEADSFDSERAFFMAKGAAESMFALFAKDGEIPKSGPIVADTNGDYVFPLESGEVRLRFESAAGLIDLNEASDKLLASMFDSVGVSQEQRNHLVDSILDWRDGDDIPHLYGAEINDYQQIAGQRLPRNAPFQSVDELLQVKNMTPQIFGGSLVLDTSTRQYKRLPGIRELVTVDSHSEKIEINEASLGVLQAMPQIQADVPERIVAERTKKPFSSIDDVVQRIPDMQGSNALQYMVVTQPTPVPTALVSRAIIRSSGASRTVRLVFKREDRFQVLRPQPLLYRIVQDIKFSHWQF
jgi:general secretion pathway protein K